SHVDVREIGKQALVGFLIGGTGRLGGAAIAGRFLLAGVQGGAAQIGDNLLHGRAWSDDVLQSAGIGVATMGLSAGGGVALRRVLNRAGASVIGDGERSAVGSVSGQPLSADTTAAIRPGRLGNVDHRAEVADIQQDIEARGLTSRTEFGFETPSGVFKSRRFADVVALDSERRVVEIY